MRKSLLHALCLCAALLLTACATKPRPIDGAIELMIDWWRRFDDPLLVSLIERAQAASPDIASAAARLAEANANRVAAAAALMPNLGGTFQASRGNSAAATRLDASESPVTTLQAGLQSSWEIDLFGGLSASRNAAQARVDGAQARWHAARISVAADTAKTYFDERACQRELAVSGADARSRSETARLTELAMRAGFQAPADAARARASASDGASRLTHQRAQCTLLRKALVALTGLNASVLDAKLDSAPVQPALPTVNAIEAVPAAALAQRPDVYAAERAVAAASFDAGAAQARRYPRLSLTGSISAFQFRMGDFPQSLDTWSIGPLLLEVPIFDGGTRAANADAARVRYDEAVAQYRATVRQAVREVESALVTLQSTNDRFADATNAVTNYQSSFDATQTRYNTGLVSLFELEDARRTLFLSQTTLVGLQRDRAEAFVALYRAMGGGWQRPSGARAVSSASPSP